MLNKLRTTLGFGAVTTIAAASLVALPTEAAAGVECTTILSNTPVHSEPSSAAPITTQVPLAGTVLGCSGGPGWFHAQDLQNGQWIGYVQATYVDTGHG